jgi:hypothetical protein
LHCRSGAYINSKIPQTKTPITISPTIRSHIGAATRFSRKTLSYTNRAKKTVLSKVFDAGYNALRDWSAKDNKENYSTVQNMCFSVLNSAGILIQATEESVGIIAAPTLKVTQEFASRTLGPDAGQVVAEAFEGMGNFYLVYFDNSGVSRRAFLKTTRKAALRTSEEIRGRKIKLNDRKSATSATISSSKVKELIFKHVGKLDGSIPSSISSVIIKSSL